MTGIWKGWHEAEKTTLAVGTTADIVQFTMNINSADDNGFSGMVKDQVFHLTDGFGIIGNVDGNSVSFQKFKTTDSDADGIKKVNIENSIGPVIHYSGILNINDSEIAGNWSFQLPQKYLFGFIPLRSRSTRGRWAMKLSKRE